MLALFQKSSAYDTVTSRLEGMMCLAVVTLVSVLMAAAAGGLAALIILAMTGSFPGSVAVLVLVLSAVLYVVNGLIYAHAADDRGGTRLDEALIGVAWPVVCAIGVLYTAYRIAAWTCSNVWNLVWGMAGRVTDGMM
jgi:hypothetical protein